jgi:hypothetical protein
MRKDKPIIFRSLILYIRDGKVTLSFEGVRNLLLNLSMSVDVSQCKASNPLDTFESLVGAGAEAELNKVTRAALAAAALFASDYLSLLDAFVLGEPHLLKLAKPQQVPELVEAAAAFGYTGALLELLATKPSSQVLDDALSRAAECGRTEALAVLLEAGAATTFEIAV